MRAPAPTPSSLDAEYWRAAAEGRLVLQRCKKTGRFQHYPRAHALGGGGSELEWVDSPGRGVVVTFTVVARSFYENVASGTAIVVVDLDEGVRITGHVDDPQGLRIGARVVARFVGGSEPRLTFVV